MSRFNKNKWIAPLGAAAAIILHPGSSKAATADESSAPAPAAVLADNAIATTDGPIATGRWKAAWQNITANQPDIADAQNIKVLPNGEPIYVSIATPTVQPRIFALNNISIGVDPRDAHLLQDDRVAICGGHYRTVTPEQPHADFNCHFNGVGLFVDLQPLTGIQGLSVGTENFTTSGGENAEVYGLTQLWKVPNPMPDVITLKAGILAGFDVKNAYGEPVIAAGQINIGFKNVGPQLVVRAIPCLGDFGQGSNHGSRGHCLVAFSFGLQAPLGQVVRNLVRPVFQRVGYSFFRPQPDQPKSYDQLGF